MGLMSNLIPGYLTMPHGEGSRLQTLHVHAAASSRCGPNQISYWQNYHEVLRQPPEGDVRRCGHGGERLGLRLLPEARHADLRRPAGLRADASGQDQRLFLPGLQSASRRPRIASKITQSLSKLKFLVTMDPLRDGDGAVLGESRRLQRRRHRSDPDRSDSSCRRPVSRRKKARSPIPDAGCNGTGRPARRRARPSTTTGSWRRSSPRLRDALSKGRRRIPRPDPQSHWHYKNPHEPKPDELAKEYQRQGAGGHARSDRPDQGCAARRASSSLNFSQLARRRHDGVRLLDLFRLLQRSGQQHGPPRQHRPGRPRHLSRTGRGRGRSTGASSTIAPRRT